LRGVGQEVTGMVFEEEEEKDEEEEED